MTRINDNNIEKWFFDYHEGNLNQADMTALEKFVLLNPSYESEMDAWSNAYVESEVFEYQNADSLYQKKRKIGWIGWSSAAAVLVTGITLSFLYLLPGENISSISDSTNETSFEKEALGSSSQSSKGTNTLSTSAFSTSKNTNTNLTESNKDSENKEIVNESTNGIETAPNTNQSTASQFSDFNENTITKEERARENSLVSNNQASNQNPITKTKALNTPNSQVNNQTPDEQNQEVFASNSTLENDLTNDSHNEKLISTIPGKSNPSHQANEFAHLEPVKPTIEKDIIINQALSKLDFESEAYSGSYDNNPNYSENNAVDLSSNLKTNSRKSTSKVLRDFKRAFNNRSGVTNLRDPNLVIPGYNPLTFNPSLAGGMLKTRIQGSYMTQWTGTAAMQQIAHFSADGYVYSMRGGVGVDVKFRDYAKGMYRQYDVALMYSPKINVGKFLAIEPSLKFNMGSYTLNPNKVVSGGQIEIERGNVYQTFENGEAPIGTSKIYYDLGAGLFVNTKWFYAGFSMDNLFRHKENIYSNDLNDIRKAPFGINVVVGTDFESSNKNFTGSPFFVYQHYDQFDEFFFGSNFRVFWGTAGFGLSDKGSVSAQAGIQFKKFKMTYQYDWTRSKLLGTKGHSHELMFRFSIKPKRGHAKQLGL